MKTKTVYAVWTIHKEVIGDFNTAEEVTAYLQRQTQRERDQVDHIFAREVKVREGNNE